MINPVFEIVGLSAAFLTTSAFIPQVYKIYKEKNADGISLTMYIILFTGVILWFIYGILIGSLSIIIANGVTALLQLSIIIFKLKNS
ncbi:SemiSWEET transporter [Flavobacteriaceae bacterium]|jgi:MtN3 and saliva related transmembrane protein|nr:SemiSWEET transporter [Flavobacteriaceae bacterium]|tara:strand:- start:377 stop:637 length:261 start_codon:yes stop_codon:yes gene_type:complete